MKKIQKRFIPSLLIIIILIICYARYIEPEGLVVKKITIETDKEIEDCKIVFFSDTHFGALYNEKHAKKIVDTLNKRKADFIIFGGDLLDNYERDKESLDIEYLQKELSRIKAKSGKYAVFGNHDYGGGAYKIYQDFMNDCGFQVLVNEHIILENYQIDLIGFDDYQLGQTEPSFYHLETDQFHLIATHEPVISKLVQGSGDSFVLSGHTHGGQVMIPYITKKLLPVGCDQFIKGFYTAQDIHSEYSIQLYVSSGIGLTKYPFRFLNIPEIIEVNLIKRKQ